MANEKFPHGVTLVAQVTLSDHALMRKARSTEIAGDSLRAIKVAATKWAGFMGATSFLVIRVAGEEWVKGYYGWSRAD